MDQVVDWVTQIVIQPLRCVGLDIEVSLEDGSLMCDGITLSGSPELSEAFQEIALELQKWIRNRG